MKARSAKDGSYLESFKKTIVRQVEAGRITKAEANRKYEIGHSTILRWQHKYSEIITKR